MGALTELSKDSSMNNEESLYDSIKKECLKENMDALVKFAEMSDMNKNILDFIDALRQDALEHYKILILEDVGSDTLRASSYMNCKLGEIKEDLSFVFMTMYTIENRTPNTPAVLAIQSEYHKVNEFVPLMFTRAMFFNDDKDLVIEEIKDIVKFLQTSINSYAM